jgi:ATP-dependent Clp protease ATP-binding subunit ClpX
LRSRAEERAGAPVSETVRQGERALKFTQGALRAIAREALKCKSGARGLRAIMESIMVDLMYEIPSQPNIKEVLISEEVVTEKEQPLLVYQKTAETA